MPNHDDSRLKCSFCGKTQEQVKKLIAGPDVYICDECVELCNEILDEDRNLDENLRSNSQNSLDLKQVLWQNIVLEVPLRFSKTDKPAVTEGDGWKLKSEFDKKEDSKEEQKKEIESLKAKYGNDVNEYKNEVRNAKAKIGGEMYKRFMQGFNKGKKDEEIENQQHTQFLFKKLKF